MSSLTFKDARRLFLIWLILIVIVTVGLLGGCVVPPGTREGGAVSSSNQPATIFCLVAMCDVQLADRSALAGEGANQSKGDEVTTSTSSQEADIDADVQAPGVKLENPQQKAAPGILESGKQVIEAVGGTDGEGE